MLKTVITLLLLSLLPILCTAQNVGIGITTPLARLHVADSSVLFTGPSVLPNNPGPAPINGAGARMMWYASKAAFRAGYAKLNEWDTEQIGTYSFGAGYRPAARGDYSIAIGSSPHAAAESSTAIGVNALANAPRAIAFGYNALSSGPSAVAIGVAPIATANASVAIGTLSHTNGDYSTSLGHGAISMTWGQTTVGSYNTTTFGAYANQWVASDPAFVIGNGKSQTERSTAMTVLKNGNTGIGTTSPKSKLHIEGNVLIGNTVIVPAATLHTEGNILSKHNSTTGSGQLILEETLSTDGSRISFRNSNIANRFWDVYGASHATNNAQAEFAFYYQASGNIFKLQGNGNAWLKGSLNQNSDKRLKQNITPINQAMQKLQKLSGYTYYWKDGKLDQRLQAGVLAQEVETVFPEMVTLNAEGHKTVNYTALIPYLLQAVKEQQEQLDYLKAQLLEQKIVTLIK